MTGNDPASRYWEGWLEDPDRSEQQLRNYTLTLVQAAHSAAHDSDFETLKKIDLTYSTGAQIITSEPYLSTYETGKFMIQLIVADSCALNDRNRLAWDLSEEVLEWLEAADLRRSDQEIAAKPNSEIRLTALGIEALSYYSEPTLSAKLTMQSKVDTFWNVADMFWDNLRRPEAKPAYRDAMHHLTAIYELEVCKACLRLDGQHAKDAVDSFNHRHGKELFLQLGHFRDLDESTVQSAFYWDYEFAKLMASPEPDDSELRLCARKRLAGARLSFGSAPLDVLEKHWQLQQRQQRH